MRQRAKRARLVRSTPTQVAAIAQRVHQVITRNRVFYARVVQPASSPALLGSRCALIVLPERTNPLPAKPAVQTAQLVVFKTRQAQLSAKYVPLENSPRPLDRQFALWRQLARSHGIRAPPLSCFVRQARFNPHLGRRRVRYAIRVHLRMPSAPTGAPSAHKDRTPRRTVPQRVCDALLGRLLARLEAPSARPANLDSFRVTAMLVLRSAARVRLALLRILRDCQCARGAPSARSKTKLVSRRVLSAVLERSPPPRVHSCARDARLARLSM